MAALNRIVALAAVALLCASGCPVYNEECSPMVERPDEITGWLSGDVLTIKSETRSKENALGQLVGEAYFHAFDGREASLLPDLGFENGGSIRSEGVCESREIVKKGAVKRKVLREVLPFDDEVVVVSITHRQLKNMLEHAIASLTPAGNANPSGAFLHVYGGTISANCNRPAETLKSDGTRDLEGQRITSITLIRRTGESYPIPLNPVSDTETVRVAVNSYMLAGGDNFVDLKNLDPTKSKKLSAGGFNFEIIAQYFKTAYTEQKPLPAQASTRWNLTDCR
ncbi:MAG: 5'-nucleotidase C-terminal domain-containing protein [Deltaproteobacteria bacterium]|nr:5'-nucleotidase C-terminal domain-containing protein [Deltaproteobacteria bacterium]